MDPNTPMVLAGASYASRDDAVEAFKIVWGARHQGEFDHMDVAVLAKDANGELQVERHDSTAKHFAWGGALLGAALVIVAPPVGIAAIAVGAGAVAGAGGIVGHFWNNIPKEKLGEVSELIHSGEAALVIVASTTRAPTSPRCWRTPRDGPSWRRRQATSTPPSTTRSIRPKPPRPPRPLAERDGRTARTRAAVLAGARQLAGPSTPHALPCRAANAGPALAGRVPGQYAVKAPHRRPGPRRATR